MGLLSSIGVNPVFLKVMLKGDIIRQQTLTFRFYDLLKFLESYCKFA